MTILVPKILFAHAVTLATAVPTWLAWLGIGALGIAFVYFLVGAIRAQMKWDEEKEAPRRFGGKAPKK